jgi:hypothetical protein
MPHNCHKSLAITGAIGLALPRLLAYVLIQGAEKILYPDLIPPPIHTLFYPSYALE